MKKYDRAYAQAIKTAYEILKDSGNRFTAKDVGERARIILSEMGVI